MTTRQQVCEQLDTTPGEVEVGAQSVDEWMQFLVDLVGVDTTVELPNGTRLHRHQLVVGPDDQTWIALDLNDETIELVEISPPIEADSPAFGVRDVISHGRFVLAGYTAQFRTSRDGRKEPVWAY